MIKLSSVFSDWMVLQRDIDDNKIWGYAQGSVDIQFQNEDKENGFDETFSLKVECGKDGYFEACLKSHPAGGDFTLIMQDEEKGAENIIINHITFGDVFVCGGQSNMELPLARTLERYEEELKDVDNQNIRFFRVPEKYNFHHTEEMIEAGCWQYAKQPEMLNFGAVAYFTAKEISEKENVTVGIYNTAIGGTPIKSWCSEETMKKVGLHVEEYKECQDDEWVQNTIKKEGAEDMAWREDADKSFEGDLSGNLSGTFEVPGFFEGTPLGDKCLAVYFKKGFTLPAGWTDKDAKLYLGAIIDSDKVYVNGKYVGETGYLYPPRIYKVPQGILKEGKNVVEIRLLVFRKEGGFMPGKDYMLKRSDGEIISLAGEWEYTVAKEMPYIENMTFFSYKATGVYNCMIYPLRRQKCRGFFFYQGESNVDDFATYTDEFEAVIEDWRALWGDENLPFMFIQLAAFNDGNRNGYFGRRCLLTEAQRQCTELPNTAMIQAYDLGEFNDLHPTNKKEVGRRCMLAAEDLVYGNETYIPGPEVDYIDWHDDEGYADVIFDEGTKLILSHGIGAEFGPDRDEENVHGFTIRKSEGHGYVDIKVEAEITAPNVVRVKLPDDIEVLALMYAWADSPLEANLYSEDRLPVVPFWIPNDEIIDD